MEGFSGVVCVGVCKVVAPLSRCASRKKEVISSGVSVGISTGMFGHVVAKRRGCQDSP